MGWIGTGKTKRKFVHHNPKTGHFRGRIKDKNDKMLETPWYEDEALAVRKTDMLIYKIKGPSLVNLPLLDEDKKLVESMSVKELMDYFKIEAGLDLEPASLGGITAGCGKSGFKYVQFEKSKGRYRGKIKDAAKKAWTTIYYDSDEECARATDMLIYKIKGTDDTNFPVPDDLKQWLDSITLEQLHEHFRSQGAQAQTNISNNPVLRFSSGNSKYRGVHKRHNKWRVQFNNRHIGVYETEIEAAKAYNAAALDELGELAVLNDIEEEEEADE